MRDLFEQLADLTNDAAKYNSKELFRRFVNEECFKHVLNSGSQKRKKFQFQFCSS